jgi:leucyl-tRNA synthetase
MSLFIHSAIWEDDSNKWPRGFYCNGYIQVNSEKMSKSKGNFRIIEEICN